MKFFHSFSNMFIISQIEALYIPNLFIIQKNNISFWIKFCLKYKNLVLLFKLLLV